MLSNFQNQLIAGAARPRHSKSAVTLNVNNTTGSKVAFTVTGSVLILGIWGEVTTAISSNHTKGHLRTNDQTATIDITESVTGITLSSLAVGTMIYKESLAAVALSLQDNVSAKMEEPAAAGQFSMSPFIVTKKTAAVTTIDYRYTTTNAPSTGAILFNVLWIPLSADGNLA